MLSFELPMNKPDGYHLSYLIESIEHLYIVISPSTVSSEFKLTNVKSVIELVFGTKQP